MVHIRSGFHQKQYASVTLDLQWPKKCGKTPFLTGLPNLDKVSILPQIIFYIKINLPKNSLPHDDQSFGVNDFQTSE